jgi:hypothetical protein
MLPGRASQAEFLLLPVYCRICALKLHVNCTRVRSKESRSIELLKTNPIRTEIQNILLTLNGTHRRGLQNTPDLKYNNQAY